MKRLGSMLLVAALALTGCAGNREDASAATASPDRSSTAVTHKEPPPGATPASGLPGSPQASPNCFVYHDPRAQGPGPSDHSLEVHGPQPLFPGSAMRLTGSHWGSGAKTVKLLLLHNVENAMWYGTNPDLVRCLGPIGEPLGVARVQSGAWEWEGSLPDLQEGAAPTLVAVDDLGMYYLAGLQMYGANGLVKPYTLAVESDSALPPGRGFSDPLPRGTRDFEPLPPVQPVAVGSRFRLVGSALSERNESVRIHLDYHDDKGGDWVLLGSGQLHGDRLETQTLVIPDVLNILGVTRTAVLPATYRLVITNDRRPYEIFYILSIQLLPAPPG